MVPYDMCYEGCTPPIPENLSPEIGYVNNEVPKTVL